MDVSNLNNNNASNVFGAASDGISKRLANVGGLMHQQLAFQHAHALNQQYHENLMQHAGVVHSHNIELENVRHGNTSQLSQQEHTQRLESLNAETRAHGVRTEAEGRNTRLNEFSAGQNRMAEAQQSHTHTMEQGAATHARSTEFLGALRKHAEGGTEVNLTHGDVKATFTAKKKTPCF